MNIITSEKKTKSVQHIPKNILKKKVKIFLLFLNVEMIEEKIKKQIQLIF